MFDSRSVNDAIDRTDQLGKYDDVPRTTASKGRESGPCSPASRATYARRRAGPSGVLFLWFISADPQQSPPLTRPYPTRRRMKRRPSSGVGGSTAQAGSPIIWVRSI